MLLTEGNAYPPHPVCIRAACWFCGGSQREFPQPGGARLERVFSVNRYLDSDDIDFPDAGGIWMCESCMIDVARVLRFVAPEEHAAVVAARDQLAAELDDVQDQLNEAVVLNVMLRRFDEKHRAEVDDVEVAAAGVVPPSPAAGVRAAPGGATHPAPGRPAANQRQGRGRR